MMAASSSSPQVGGSRNALVDSGITMKSSEQAPSPVSNQMNFLSQLEMMMTNVKKEAGALDAMKLKLKNMEELKVQFQELKSRLTNKEEENINLRNSMNALEQVNNDLRRDMQQLNDIYFEERTKCGELQQIHSTLEQQVNGLILERDFFSRETSKIPEMKAKYNSLKTKFMDCKKKAEEEQKQFEMKFVEQKQLVARVERANEDSAKHISILQEQLHESKMSKSEQERVMMSINSASIGLSENNGLLLNRLLMLQEDNLLQLTRGHDKTNELNHLVATLQANLQQSKYANKNQTEEALSLREEIQQLRRNLQENNSLSNLQIASLNQKLHEVTEKHNEAVKDSSHLKQALASKTHELDMSASELDRLRRHLEDLQYRSSQQCQESSERLKSSSMLCEELSSKLSIVTNQYETLQSQWKLEQKKHWQEVQQLKDSESQVLEEAEKLSLELQVDRADVMHNDDDVVVVLIMMIDGMNIN
jgi:chromosome segregation ATPase